MFVRFLLVFFVFPFHWVFFLLNELVIIDQLISSSVFIIIKLNIDVLHLIIKLC